MQNIERVKVTIDLDKVAKNLRTADGECADVGSAESFMRYAGFDSDPDGKWVGLRAALRHFNPGEVMAVEPMFGEMLAVKL